MEDRRAGRLPSVKQTRYEAFGGAGGTAQEPLVLQSFLPPAPWPLQAFLPAQLWRYSFEAQSPLPLHSFLPPAPWPLQPLRPLQACLSPAFFSSAICTACEVA